MHSFSLRFYALAAGENLADLTDRHPPLDPAEDVADFIDIGLGIEAVPTFGARGLNEPITTLPSAQGDRVDTCQTGDFANGEQLLMSEITGIQRRLGRFKHCRKTTILEG
ncbi:hypothetical protein D9M73_217410 [compost metagenome]